MIRTDAGLSAIACRREYVDEVICSRTELAFIQAERKSQIERTKTKRVVKRIERWYFLRREYSIQERAGSPAKSDVRNHTFYRIVPLSTLENREGWIDTC